MNCAGVLSCILGLFAYFVTGAPENPWPPLRVILVMIFWSGSSQLVSGSVIEAMEVLLAIGNTFVAMGSNGSDLSGVAVALSVTLGPLNIKIPHAGRSGTCVSRIYSRNQDGPRILWNPDPLQTVCRVPNMLLRLFLSLVIASLVTGSPPSSR